MTDEQKQDWREFVWRNYVSQRLRKIWFTFTPERRRLLLAEAEERATNELSDPLS